MKSKASNAVLKDSFIKVTININNQTEKKFVDICMWMGNENDEKQFI